MDKSRARQEGGAGLGLSIVECAVSVHRETVEVETEAGLVLSFGYVFLNSFPLSGLGARLTKDGE